MEACSEEQERLTEVPFEENPPKEAQEHLQEEIQEYSEELAISSDIDDDSVILRAKKILNQDKKELIVDEEEEEFKDILRRLLNAAERFDSPFEHSEHSEHSEESGIRSSELESVSLESSYDKLSISE